VPVSCALLLESANGTACTAGAVIGLCIAVATWLYVACINDINGEISLASTGGQYPLLFGPIFHQSYDYNMVIVII
jgi:urea-proton symporter